MPERTSYRVTSAGRREFDDWLERELRVVADRDYPRVIFALKKVAWLAPDRVAALLRERVTELHRELGQLDAVLDPGRGIPRVSLLEAEYARIVRRAESDWLRDVLADLDSGRLTWNLRPTTEEDR
jgi:hypothetical protein